MQQAQTRIDIPTRGMGTYEFTREVEAFVAQSGIETGLVTIFCRHTSSSLIVMENADPDVQRDLVSYFRRIAPEGMEWMVHTLEGPDDMPAHIRTALTQSSISIPLGGGEMLLGTWQGLFLFEHRARPHRRQLVLHIVGE